MTPPHAKETLPMPPQALPTPSLETPLPHGIRPDLPAVAVGTLGQRLKLSMPWTDLSDDEFIVKAPRILVEGRPVPALGGIPLFSKLGQGGMGAVYYGVHPGFVREVAVKVLHFHLAHTNPEHVFRFFREARIASKIQSMNLVRVTDVATENTLTYIVMDYVHGKTTDAILKMIRKGGAAGMDEGTALDICIAACRGLAAAHDERVIHRDIKPDNILVPRKKDSNEFDFDRAKLCDLGIARCEDLHATVTAAQMSMGTPGYMAPEQIEDARSVGKPADVFAMGATLYELLTGSAPFVGQSSTEIFKATARLPHTAARTLRSEISKPTAEVIDICLAKIPAHRYSDGAALLRALQACRKLLADPHSGDYDAVTQPRLDRERAAPEEQLVIGPNGKIMRASQVKSGPTAVPADHPLRAIYALTFVAALLCAGIYWYTGPTNKTKLNPAPGVESLDQDEATFDRNTTAKARTAAARDEYAKKIAAQNANHEAAAASRIEFDNTLSQARAAIEAEHWEQAQVFVARAAANPLSDSPTNKSAVEALKTALAEHALKTK